MNDETLMTMTVSGKCNFPLFELSCNGVPLLFFHV